MQSKKWDMDSLCDAIWSGTQIKVRQVIERPFSSALYRSSGWNAASCLVFAPDTIMWLIHHPGMNPDASSFSSITWSVFRGAILHKSVQVQTHQTRRMTVPVKMTTSRLANKFSGTMQKPGATSLWHDSTAVRQDCVTPAILSRSLANLNLLSRQQFIDSQCWAILHSTVPKHELLFSSYSTLYFKEWLKTMGQCVRLLAAIYIKRVMLFEVTFLLHFTFKTSPFLLQLLRWMSQCCLVVKLQKSFVDYETSPDWIFWGGEFFWVNCFL